MACGSCGQSRKTLVKGSGQATGDASSGAKYTVQSPDGTSTTFDRYIDAAVHRRQVNGTLTTHT